MKLVSIPAISEMSSLMKSGDRLAMLPSPAYPLPASSTAKRKPRSRNSLR
jgi:hypothetical protein